MRDYEDTLRDATRTAALGSGIGGLLAGGGAAILAGKRQASRIARDALLAGLGGGALAGGGTYLGGRIMGADDPENPDTGAYTKRGAVGAGLAGAGTGALLGAAGAAGLGRGPDNLVGDYLRKLARKRSISGISKGAGLGALALGGIGAYLGASEGTGVDFLENERRRREEAIGG